MNASTLSDTGRPSASRAAATHGNRLYLGTAILLCVTAFAGFAPSYWAPMAAGTLDVHPALHVHGTLFFAWTVYFIVQAALVVEGRVAWHRELGLFGIALAALMVFSGILATIVNLRSTLPLQPVAARSVTALSVSAMLMFTVFVGVAIANVRRPDPHRRLMVLASFAIIGAAVVRLMRFVPDTTQPERALLGAGVVDVLLLGVVLLDRRATGRTHAVWIWGGGFLLANQVLRAVIARTETWADICDWLAALGG